VHDIFTDTTHYVDRTPQIIHFAGASHPIVPSLNGEGAGPSARVTPEAAIATQPELLIISPCGLDLAAAKREADLVKDKPWWQELVKGVKRIAIVDGNQMFNRPGPRLVDALEFMVGFVWDKPELIPQGFPWEKYDL
jgi:ABC-type Fe3+-hydroxamate transport system substrate-binding protein